MDASQNRHADSTPTIPTQTVTSANRPQETIGSGDAAESWEEAEEAG